MDHFHILIYLSCDIKHYFLFFNFFNLLTKSFNLKRKLKYLIIDYHLTEFSDYIDKGKKNQLQFIKFMMKRIRLLSN